MPGKHRLPHFAERVRGRLKLCTYCDPPQWRDIEEFTSHPNTRDGRDNRCNFCRSRYRRERRLALRSALDTPRIRTVNTHINTRVTIVVPPNLLPALDRLVTEQALRTKEEPDQVRRAVEITVLQRGIAALREGLTK